jgi:hypothetical protein
LAGLCHHFGLLKGKDCFKIGDRRAGDLIWSPKGSKPKDILPAAGRAKVFVYPLPVKFLMTVSFIPVKKYILSLHGFGM